MSRQKPEWLTFEAKPGELRGRFRLIGALVSVVILLVAAIVANNELEPPSTDLGIAALVLIPFVVAKLDSRIMLAVQRRWDRRVSESAV